MDESALVSVYVLTYNSSNTVLDTLSSIYRQTYSNLELIISDDCSNDDTIQVCNKWIYENKERFFNVELLNSSVNLGISANNNKALKACKGNFIKGIAGDDILLPNCIMDFVDFMGQYPEAVFVYSNFVVFNDVYKPENIIHPNHNRLLADFGDKTAKEQLDILVLENVIPAPTIFSRNVAELDLEETDSKYYFEDWPRWINLTEKGIKLYYLNKETIAYRQHVGSAMSQKGTAFPYKIFASRHLLFKSKLYKYLNRKGRMAYRMEFIWASLFDKFGLNNNNRIIMVFFWYGYRKIARMRISHIKNKK